MNHFLNNNTMNTDYNALRLFGIVPVIYKGDPENQNVNPPNNEPNNRKRRSQRLIENKNKRFKSDDEIVNLLLNQRVVPPEKNDDDDNSNCNNPLCDHMDFTPEELEEMKNRLPEPPR